MKRLIYQVYTGKRKKLYDHCTASVAAYCKEHGIQHIVQRTPILMIKPDVFMTNRSKESYEKHGGYLPIYEKENAFTYFNTYDQVLILDGDVWIRPDSPNVFDELDPNTDFAGVVEREMPLTEKYFGKIANYSKMQYTPIKNVDWKWDKHGAEFFNMGLMLMNSHIKKYLNGETPMQFLMRPRHKAFIDGLGPWKWSTDQTLLNTWVKEEKMNTKHLHWKWNALFNAIPHDKMKQAHFIHFFHKDLIPNEGEDIEVLMRLVV
tara:strand:+ start:3135 stop:3920 length:786 start_codon:yes stop_codon:yes gene_type:complete